ncbi:hypothetical protein V6N13_084663 [Hibiscus sabdariffa]|uniref:Uncharacterized protein n=1 Tax=Hibiscus sabdariffa TaxID=183260 RepID=A0ABR2T1N7_9ROSI
MLEPNILLSGFMESECSSIVYHRYPIRNISYSGPHVHVKLPRWLSPQNDYLFFNCSEDYVIVEPKPIFCQGFPDRVPKADAEVCASYTNVYWRTMSITDTNSPSSQVSKYGSGSISMFRDRNSSFGCQSDRVWHRCLVL